MVGRSREITGPYVDFDGRPMLDGRGTLVLAGYGHVRGPGHAGIFRDGQRDLLVHHFYDADDDGRSKVQVRPVLWTPDDWPLPGEPIAAATTQSAPPAALAGRGWFPPISRSHSPCTCRRMVRPGRISGTGRWRQIQ